MGAPPTGSGDFPDDRPIFEPRPVLGKPWIWEVWDIEHPSKCGDFPVLRVDSKGASDDFHAEYARVCSDALNARYAAEANRQRRDEASAMSAGTAETQSGSGLQPASAVAATSGETPNPSENPHD
jgi:hypothetical protein